MEHIKNFFNTVFSQGNTFVGTLYYDETNNFRKFYLRENGWNCEALNVFFILGGIAVQKGQEISTKDLLSDLNLQSNIKDIKFRHFIGKAKNFENILKSEKIDILLDWLLKNDLHIHYLAMNYIYFALVDIVDAAMSQYTIYDYTLDIQLKNRLYEIVKKNIDYFVDLLYEFSYPNITDTSGFMSKFLPFIEAHQINITSIEDDFITEYLRQIIKTASKQGKLDFFQGEESHIIFNDFTSLYVCETMKFPNAEIIFDKEQVIEDKEVLSEVKFVDSKCEIMVQLSDVVVGLISKYYTFLEKTENIVEVVNRMSDKSKVILRKLTMIIKKSSQFNTLFDAYLGGRGAIENHWKICDYLGSAK